MDYLKIDAQGFDLEVVKSLGKYLHSVKKIKLEAKAADVPGFYKNQPDPSTGKIYIRGFRESLHMSRVMDRL